MYIVSIGIIIQNNRKPTMAVVKWSILLVVILSVVAANASGNSSLTPPCKVSCLYPASSPTFFSTPEQGDLNMHRSLCNVTVAAADTSVCALDVEPILRPVVHENVTVVDYNIITCVNKTRVEFVNPSGMRHKNVIGYLYMSGCDVHWSDLVTYAKAVDLRVLYIVKRNDTFEQDREKFEAMSTIVPGGLNELPESLQCIGSIWFLRALPKGRFPSIITEYVWPRMAEIAIHDADLELIPPELAQSMPNLQSLEIKNNNFSQPPTIFPWHNDVLALPLNLSRTPNGNHHYTVSQGFETPPHLYRRMLDLKQNQLNNLESVVFRGCIQKIVLSENRIEAFSKETFGSVRCLQNLEFSHNKLKSLPVFSFQYLHNLTSLDLSFNEIEVTLTKEHFAGLELLQKLDLSQNRITNILDFTFYALPSMAELNLASNKLITIPDQAISFKSDKLLTVHLMDNNITHIPHWVFLVRNLQEINMQMNNISFSSFMESIFGVDESHIVFNNRWSASQHSLVPRRSLIKVIRLHDNQFVSLDIADFNHTVITHLKTVLLFFNLDLDENSLNCDCRMYSMHRYLLEEAAQAEQQDVMHNLYALKNWKCSVPAYVNGELVSKVSNETFKCVQEFPDCPEECECLERSVDTVVEVDCSGRNLKKLPERLPPKTQIFNMAHNSLVDLNDAPTYLVNLTSFDLSFNNISHISGNFAEKLDGKETVSLHHNKLTSLPETLKHVTIDTLYLKFNRWACDCHAVWLKQWLLRQRRNIQDLDEVVCSSGRAQGMVMIEVPESMFICEVPPEVLIAKTACGFIVVVIVVLAAMLILYRFRGEIKIYLYVHFKWHPFDRSESTDLDFDYDAFVSYAGDDYKWVVYQLVSRLEGSVPPFKLCLHDRDFEVGAPIQHNIMHSVKQSRRMIMVLTRRYLRSEWCMLEFRAAHERVLNDRSNYLILVLFDDIKIDELEDDMKLYLRTNTYLSVSNKWFWEKLEYAMPKEPLCTLREDIVFDFPFLTAPPTTYPDYLMGYIATDKTMAERTGYTFQEDEEDEVEEEEEEEGDANCNVSRL